MAVSMGGVLGDVSPYTNTHTQIYVRGVMLVTWTTLVYFPQFVIRFSSTKLS
jgi:hypothetical protein